MMKKIIYILFPLCLMAKVAYGKANCEQAKQFMQTIGNTVISLLTNNSVSDKERATQFREILDRDFNGKSIAKFVLGRYWKQASEAEQQEFLNLFKETTVNAYATRFKEYTSEKFEVTSCRDEPDEGVTVSSRIIRPNGQDIPIEWKLFEKEGKYQIYDVKLEGISMSVTQRSEYSSVIQKGGGKVSFLLNELRKNIQEHKLD